MSIRTRKLSWLLIALCLMFAVSCQTQEEEMPQSAVGMINPGDLVEDYLITTGEPGEYIPLWDIDCDESLGSDELVCKLSLSSSVNISYGIYAEPGEDLDQNWSNHTYNMAIDGQPVNLPAFGSVDADHPQVGPMRAWNIVIVPSKFGEIETTHSVLVGDDINEGKVILIFSESGTADPSRTWEEEEYPTLSPAAKSGQHPYSSEQAELDYLLYVPKDYDENSDQKWPLILYLHGGIPRYHIDMLRKFSLPKRLEEKGDLPIIVVSPRVMGEYEFWGEDENLAALDALLEEIQSTLPIDSLRIYLTGESGGGYGTWEVGLHNPDRFAALAPVAGYYGWPFTVPEKICDLKDIPVWAFHGAKDEKIPLEDAQQIVDALEECGGNLQFTIYPDAGHDDEYPVYIEPDLFNWMLSHSLK